MRSLVSAALDELTESDPRYNPLMDLEDALFDGVIPVEGLVSLVKHWGDYEHVDELPEGVRLEDEFRALAERLPEEEWMTESCVQLRQAVQRYLDGDDEALDSTIDTMTVRLEAVWPPYINSRILPQEITAETIVDGGTEAGALGQPGLR